MPPRPRPLLHLPLLIWPVKAFSPVLRDIPYYNRTPSLKVDYKRKLKPIPDREYIIQEEIYKQNVEPALNLLLPQQSEETICLPHLHLVILRLIVIKEHQQGMKSTVTEHKLHDHNLPRRNFLFSVHVLFGFSHTLNWRHREKLLLIKEEISFKIINGNARSIA